MIIKEKNILCQVLFLHKYRCNKSFLSVTKYLSSNRIKGLFVKCSCTSTSTVFLTCISLKYFSMMASVQVFFFNFCYFISLSLYTTWSSQKFNGYQLLCISTSKRVLCMLFSDWNNLFQCYILRLDLLVEIHNNQRLQLKSARKHISWSHYMKQTLSVDLWIWRCVCWPVSYSASLFLKNHQKVFRVRAKNWIFQVEDLKRNLNDLNDLKPRMGLKLQTYKSIWNYHANMQQCNLALWKLHVLEVQVSKIYQLFLYYFGTNKI